MPLKLVPEVPDGCCYRPGCSVTQGTDCIPFNVALYVPKQINITHLSFPILNIMQDFFHPSRALPARRTLSAAFMTIKSCQCQCVSDYALVFVQNNKSSRSHHRACLETAVRKAFISHQSFFALSSF